MQYRCGLMATDIHRVFFQYAGIDHVPHRRAPEIMEYLVVAAKFRACAFWIGTYSELLQSTNKLTPSSDPILC
jgi:hypothetical protein